MNARASGKNGYRRWLWLAAVSLLALSALPTWGDNHLKLDDNDDKNQNSATPPGLYITPTALPHSVQQVLNPGLTNYPNFVAGEAVKAVVSPDGTTLAILTAGRKSPIESTGFKGGTAGFPQFLFFFHINCGNKNKPFFKKS